jgi:magnesium chelatase subunit D
VTEDAQQEFGVVLQLLATAPHALGGLVLRGWPGPRRDGVCAALSQLLPCVRVPLHTTDDRLLGGLSLAASLRHGRLLFERGLLAAADGGVLVLPMAERLEARRVAQLCSVLDSGRVAIEREGISHTEPCQVGLVALDEGLEDEQVPEALRERLAFALDLEALQRIDAQAARDGRMTAACALLFDVDAARQRVERARRCWWSVVVDDAWSVSLCEAALALGVSSLRAPLLAARVAQLYAALFGRVSVDEEAVVFAARWVLGPRATQLPVPAESAQATPPQRDEPTEDTQLPELDARQELIVAAAKSGVPRQLFETLSRSTVPRTQRVGKAGAQHKTAGGGRAIGVRSAPPSAAERLHVLETLRAAAPWQRLRGREPGAGRVVIHRDDLRVRRYERRSETTVIFSVDASGSLALQRLAEAKGAVEQLLIDCYSRRDHVALVAFRERAASLVLAPTRSLTRVRKSLAQLAGGGATPLASGIDAAGALALSARKQGSLPIIVLMTDARANVSRDGEHGSASAMRDALAAARELRGQLIASLFLDTSPRPREQAQRLAAELGAHYLPLPYLDAAGISAEVRALSSASRSRT